MSTPDVVQTLTEEELPNISPGGYMGSQSDDPATERVFAAGKAGKPKAAKWGSRSR